MAECLIFTGLLEAISQTGLVKMLELQGNCHFQISTAIFTAMQSRPTGGHH